MFKKVEVSARLLVVSPSKESPSDLGQAAYCLLKTQQMYACWRRDDAINPEIMAPAVAAVLSEYPAEIVDYVTDPRTGLPSFQNYAATVKEVRDACNARYQPILDAARRERELTQQFEERERIAIPNYKPRAGVERISYAEFEKRGGLRPIGRFEDEKNIPAGCKPLRPATSSK